MIFMRRRWRYLISYYFTDLTNRERGFGNYPTYEQDRKIKPDDIPFIEELIRQKIKATSVSIVNIFKY